MDIWYLFYNNAIKLYAGQEGFYFFCYEKFRDKPLNSLLSLASLLNIPESDDYETLAGLVLFYYKSIPKINDRIRINGFLIRILDVSETRIELIHLDSGQET